MNKNPNVFMIGWEYPPHNSGGLGVACDGLTQALAQHNTNIQFTLPYLANHSVSHMDIHSCVHENWNAPIYDASGAIIGWNGPETPPFLAYTPEIQSYEDQLADVKVTNSGYSFDISKLRSLSSNQLERQVSEYANSVGNTGLQQADSFEVIHAHDWMSFPAAQELKKRTGKPVIAHVHSTEYDRAGLQEGNKYITAIEHQGMHLADHIIAVSYYTKRLLEQKYQVPSNKISVVHNGVQPLVMPPNPSPTHFAQKRPVIAFMGRLTLQKGVTYFLDLAAAVIKKIPNALFVVAGSGDMYHELLFKTASAGLSASVVFSGFVRDVQQRKLLDRADVFVMPSVSEPFGLVAMEAAQRHTPVIVSKNAGVSEVLPSAVALDFWDIDKMATTIQDIVSNPDLSQQMVTGQLQDIERQSWHSSAKKITQIYKKAFLGNK